MLETNYGTEYGREKMGLLLSTMVDEGWSQYRFQETLKWFLHNKKFPAWTIADWFEFGIKVYPYAWCLEKVKEGWNWKTDIESYELPDGTVVYKPNDGVTLPFKRRTA